MTPIPTLPPLLSALLDDGSCRAILYTTTIGGLAEPPEQSCIPGSNSATFHLSSSVSLFLQTSSAWSNARLESASASQPESTTAKRNPNTSLQASSTGCYDSAREAGQFFTRHRTTRHRTSPLWPAQHRVAARVRWTWATPYRPAVAIPNAFTPQTIRDLGTRQLQPPPLASRPCRRRREPALSSSTPIPNLRRP